MTSSGGAAAERGPVRFLRDNAADEDFFGSHARVADAIISIVDASETHNVVGLLGPWGSGKSTVIKLLEGKLATSPTPTLFFTYDAWLHQSDPPRRAFLERFLAFLQSHSLATEEKWEEAMDLLSRRVEESETKTTPTLTSAGYLILLSLLLVPFGSSLVDAKWLGKTMSSHWSAFQAWVFPFGVGVTLLPLLIALFFYYLWRPVRLPFARGYFSRDNWTRHRRPHHEDSLLAIIANKQVARQKNRVVRTPDPTTIEFQKIFREMIVSAARDGHRLLIVVDNLDRLPGTEAIAMWTTIRSFFLGAIPIADSIDGRPPPPVALPTVILPIDNHAIERLFAGEAAGTGKNVADSFMEKTFDVTFHVSPPVLSEWHAYLAKLMHDVFGDKVAGQWAAEIGRIFEKKNIRPVTPRDLNRMVNAIAALWLQWEPVGIPFLTVAYYAMMRKGFEHDHLGAINSPIFDLSEHDPEWQRSLAAIHFGVAPEASLQILLEPELRSAIFNCNHRVFEKQIQTKGFERVLYGQIDTPDTMSRGLANLCVLLDRATIDDKPWAAFTWRKMRRAFLQSDLADAVDENAASTFRHLVTRVPVAELDGFLRSVGEQMTIPEPGTAAARRSLDAYRDLLAAWLEALPTALVPSMHVMIRDGSIYLEMAGLVMRGSARAHIRTSVSADNLAKLLAERAFGEAQDASFLDQAMLILHAGPGDETLGVLADHMKSLLSTRSADAFATEGAVHILGCLRGSHKFAEQALGELSGNGDLAQRTGEAFALGNHRMSSRLTALSIIAGSNLSNPGDRSWDDFLAQNPDFVDAVDVDLRAYGDDALLGPLVQLVRSNEGARVLATMIIERRWNAPGGIGALEVTDIVADTSAYLGLLSERYRPNFVADLAELPGFWDALYARNFDEGAIEIFRILIGPAHQRSEIRKRARRTLRTWLKVEIGAGRWEQEVRNGQTLLEFAGFFQDAEKKPLAIGADGAIAAQLLFDELLGNASHALRKRWFQLANMLGADARRSLMRELRDRMLAADQMADPFALLEMARAFLVRDGDFGARADMALRKLVMPHLYSLEGLAWLQREVLPVTDWAEKASQPIREELAHALTADTGDGNETARHMRAALADRWKLKA